MADRRTSQRRDETRRHEVLKAHGNSGILLAARNGQTGGDTLVVICALAYSGHDPARRSALLARVAALAPKDVAPVVREVRAARAGSPRGVAARHLWDYFNTNHCCDCHRATQPPEIAELTPAQRARVVAGEQPAGDR